MRSNGLIANDVAIRNAGEIGAGRGIDGFPTWLEGLPGIDANKQIRSICLVADSDTDPAKQFQKILDILKLVNSKQDTINHYSVPKKVGEKAGGNTIETTVILIPDAHTPGCMETLLTAVLRSNHQAIMQCVDALLACAQINAWSANKRAKATVSAAIACLLEKDPLCTLPRLWDEYPNLIPVDNVHFKPLVSQLKQI